MKSAQLTITYIDTINGSKYNSVVGIRTTYFILNLANDQCKIKVLLISVLNTDNEFTSLTVTHSRVRLNFAQQYLGWRINEWRNVLFSEESRKVYERAKVFQ